MQFHPRHQKQAKHDFASSTTKTKQSKPKRIRKTGVMEIMKSKNNKNETDLLSLALIQFEERINGLNVFKPFYTLSVYTENQKHGSLKKLKTKLSPVRKVELAELYALVSVTVLKNVRVNGMTL